MAVDSPPDTHGTQIESELNVEAGPNLNTKKEEQDRELNVETHPAESTSEPNTQKFINDLSDTAQLPSLEWQKDIEHLTDNVADELDRTNAAIGLLLLNSPKSTHIDTEDDELMENALLMPIGGEKQPDIVLEIENEIQNETQKETMTVETDNDAKTTEHNNLPQDFPTTISRKIFLQDYPTRFSCKNFLQDFPTTISHKIFPQDFPARLSCKIFPSCILIGWLPITLFQMLNFHQPLPFLNSLFPSSLSHKNFLQEFPTRFSHKIFPSCILIGWLPFTLFQMLNFHQSLPFLNKLFSLFLVPQDFPARFPTRFSHKIFLQEFSARISHDNFLQDFPARFSQAGS